MGTSSDLRSSPAVRRSDRPQRRSRLPVAVVLGAAVLLAPVALLVGLRAARAGVLPGTTVEGRDVGGLEAAELRGVLDEQARLRREEPLTVRRDALDGVPADLLEARAQDVGYRVDVDATLAAVLARGRQSNPIEALGDHLQAFRTIVEVEVAQDVDDAALQVWAQGTADTLALALSEGDVTIDGTTVTAVDPTRGVVVDAAALAERARPAVLAAGPDEVPAVASPVEPVTTAQDIAEVAAAAERAVSAPVTLTRGEAAVTFSPAEIGGALRVVRPAAPPTVGAIIIVTPDDADPIGLGIDTAAVLAAAGDTAALETEPVDAAIRLEGDTVVIDESSDGFRFVEETAARQLYEVATGDGPRTAELGGGGTPPAFTTADAEALNINEQVSTFTTNHPCCAGRVSNIHRIADLVDGVVISPGEEFSLNGFVGERTVANGFVEGGAINEGEFISAVGGGVSQFATTFFNAAFFGGYEIVEHKPHSQYISRYPEGREATINFPNVDLRIRNDSPHGLLVDTSYTGNSITVTFWGTTWVTVESATGARRNFRSSQTVVRVTDELPTGVERVVQGGGGQGFDVTVTRVLTFPDGQVRAEEYVTSYVAEPRIIERGA